MAESFRTNLTNVAIAYLQRLKVPVTRSTFKTQLEQHPYYPTLYSLNHTFEKFGIANDGFLAEPEKLNELTPPFTAYMKGLNTGSDFVLVTSFAEDQVEYLADNNKIQRISRTDFLNRWDGVILVASPGSDAGEKDYSVKLKMEKQKALKSRLLWLSALAVFIMVITGFIKTVNPGSMTTASVWLFTKTVGLTITVDKPS